jgi:hypothetical protein
VEPRRLNFARWERGRPGRIAHGSVAGCATTYSSKSRDFRFTVR